MFTGFNGIAQEIKIPKDTIYLLFKPNDGSLPDYRGIKFRNKHGLNFNLYKKEGLIHPKNEFSDTLAIKHLKNYNMTDIEDIDSLGKMWYKKNLDLLRKKYGKLIAPHDKNGKFITYIIEKFEDYFVKYRVYWRHQKP
jgi:hypothetical protein